MTARTKSGVVSGPDYNLVGMHAQEYIDYVVNTYEMSQRLGWEDGPDPIFVWGPPGAGKTFCTNKAAERCGALFHEAGKFTVKSIMMSCLEPTDLTGLPWKHDKYPYTTYLPMHWAWLASREFEEEMRKTNPDFKAPPMFLFFDDFVVAHEQVQAAGHKFFHEKMAGDLRIRPNVMLLAAGNRPEDDAGACDMKTAMASRFCHVYFKIDHEAYMKHAREKGFHPMSNAFLKAHPEMLHVFDPASADKAFPCPRTHEMLSRKMFENDALLKAARAAKLDKKSPPDFYKVAAGIIGCEGAEVLHAFLDRTKCAIEPEVIVANPETAPYPKLEELDALHATFESLIYYIQQVKPEEWRAALIYATRKDIPLQEFGIMLACNVVETVQDKLPESEAIKAFSCPEMILANEMYGPYLQHR